MSPRPPSSRERVQAEQALRRAVLARDARLQRISVATRSRIAGAVALSGVLAAIAANGFHGHAVANAGPQASAARTPASSPSNGASALQPPAQAPAQTPMAPAVASGAS